MKDIITIINQKGGVGKSTTASAVGAGLYFKGYKVLYIELDAQKNLSYSLNALNSPLTSLDLLQGTAEAEEAIITTDQGDIIAGADKLAGADAFITQKGKEYRLKEAIAPIKNNYDYIIIDTPPALGVLTVNALTAADSIIIPTQADIFSLQGVGQLSRTIDTVKKHCNNNLIVKGILVTRYNQRTNLSKDMLTLLQDTAEKLHTTLYNTKIRECVSLKEAQAIQQNIFTYAPRSNAAEDYKALLAEYLKQ